jgi:hypothetical protein
MSVRGCLVSRCGFLGQYSSGSALGVRLVLRNVFRTLYCVSYILPGASPRALLQGGSYSSGLVPCQCLAPARHVGLSRFVSAWPCPVKPFSSKKKKKRSTRAEARARRKTDRKTPYERQGGVLDTRQTQTLRRWGLDTHRLSPKNPRRPGTATTTRAQQAGMDTEEAELCRTDLLADTRDATRPSYVLAH